MSKFPMNNSVEIKDISLTDYIQIRHAISLPHTGRYAKEQFKKAQMLIVDGLMMKGGNNGNKPAYLPQTQETTPNR